MTELGGGIDELELDLFSGEDGSLRNQRATKGDDSLLATDDAATDHDVVLVDFTVVREATQRSDGLDGKISVGGGVGVELSVRALGGSSDAVHLLVDLGTVEVTILTGTSNGEGDAGRVPGTDTSDLTKTSVSLTRKTGDTPTRDDTGESLTLGHTESIDHLVLREDGSNRDLLLKETVTEVDLIGGVTTVDLDLHQVGLLLTKMDLLDLGVSQDTDDLTVLLHTGKLIIHILVIGGGNASRVLGESLLLALVPVLVEATLDLLRQVLGPDGVQGTKTTRGLDVTNQTNDDHRRGLDDGDGLDNLTLVQLGSRVVDLTHDVGHTSLVTHEGSQVWLLGSIILREGSDATAMVLGSLLRKEPEGTASRSFELTMRHTVDWM